MGSYSHVQLDLVDDHEVVRGDVKALIQSTDDVVVTARRDRPARPSTRRIAHVPTSS
jgi:hypothetical protein